MQILFWFPVSPSDLSRKTDKPAFGCAPLFSCPGRERFLFSLSGGRVIRRRFPTLSNRLSLLSKALRIFGSGALFDLRQGNFAAKDKRKAPAQNPCRGLFFYRIEQFCTEN